ncbi:MAG: DUF6879 family protein [Labedaea sp.]
MELLAGDAFDNLFRTFQHDAFHLEVQDSYHTPDEAGPFQLFLTGQHDDFAWHQPWLDLVRDTTRTGRSIRRARVVTVPHGDYTRWGLVVAPHNIAAGEDIRYLPRHLNSADLTADDYWLFDDDRVVFTVFEPDGRFVGGAATTDPTIVERCRAVRDHVWRTAIPHEQYLVSEHICA